MPSVIDLHTHATPGHVTSFVCSRNTSDRWHDRATGEDLLGTADDFSNLKVLQRNLDYRKKELFSFLTQQILARSVKKRRSYSRSKSSGLENNLSPSLREKSRFDGTTGLIFHPDNGLLAYSDNARPAVTAAACRDRRRQIFFLSVFTSTLFLVCLDATQKESCPERSRLV